VKQEVNVMGTAKGEQNNLYRHGGHSLVRQCQEGKQIDRRTQLGKYLQKTREDLIKEFDGDLNSTQRILLDRIMEKLLFLSVIGEYAKEQGRDIVKDGKIIPCLAENYIAYDNALQRNLKLLYDLKPNKKKFGWEEHLRSIIGISQDQQMKQDDE
jgi:hypothetical protein